MNTYNIFVLQTDTFVKGTRIRSMAIDHSNPKAMIGSAYEIDQIKLCGFTCDDGSVYADFLAHRFRGFSLF